MSVKYNAATYRISTQVQITLELELKNELSLNFRNNLISHINQADAPLHVILIT